MAAMVHRYTLDDFNNIMDDGLNVTLDPDTINIIQQLADQSVQNMLDTSIRKKR